MAPQGGPRQPEWILDPTRGLYYYHDQRTDELVYSNGHRIRVSRPSASNTPRTGGAPSGTQQRLPAQYDLSSSPPGDTNYGYGPGQRRPAQTPQARPEALEQPQVQQYPTDTYGQRGQQATQVRRDATVAQVTSGMGRMALDQSSSRRYDHGGIKIVEAKNPRNLVKTTIGTSPANLFTDPALYHAGIRAHRILYGSGGGEAEQLYPNYKMRKREFFAFGRVFLVLWVEPAGEAGSVVTHVEQSDQAFSTGAFNERVFSKVRRFVVIREGDTYCSALPIMTYGQRGVSKPRVKKSEHAIVYSGRTAPRPEDHEQPARGEAGMRPISIRVNPDDPTDALDPMSRLDFGKVHTIQHNIKVKPFGNVHPDSRGALYAQFQSVWSHQEQAREDDGDDDDDDDDDDDENDDEQDEGDDEEFSSSPRSRRGRASSSQQRPSRSGRAASSQQSQQRTVASSSGTSQAGQLDRSQWARQYVMRLKAQGSTNEQAFYSLVKYLMSAESKSQAEADAEVRVLLSGGEPRK